MTVTNKEGEAKLIIDTRFYGYGTVLTASQAFTDSCYVFMDGDKEDKLLVTLKPKEGADIGVETLGYEFYNYCLGLMQNARSGTQ